MPKSGKTCFVHCGADIILSGLFQDLEGEALCPICNRTIRLGIKNRNIEILEPHNTLLHYVEYAVGYDPGRFGVVCKSTFLFDGKECLDIWRDTYAGPSGKVVTPRDFLVEVSSIRRMVDT